MDKRRKHIDRDAERALRQAFYTRIQQGDISLAEAVKSMRRISLLTQAEFARHRGVSVRALKEIEAGTANPTVETLNRIGAIFGLRMGFVAGPTQQDVKSKEIATLQCSERVDAETDDVNG